MCEGVEWSLVETSDLGAGNAMNEVSPAAEDADAE
jgi:hypothetical protein